MLKLYNTLSRKIEDFKPLNPEHVTMYTCGPTVYDYTHIGHLRKYIGDDILKRVLQIDGYQVKHVMNITDVGHLSSDEDQGEDKLEKGAKKANLTVWEVAKFFEKYFLNSIKQVNIEFPDVISQATEHIGEQINLIKKLEEKGFTYITDQAIYFDVTKFPNYTKLSGQKLADKAVGVRQEVIVDEQKKHPADFALWFFTSGRFADHVMRWLSPWGQGFPGWHIECSAMSMCYLGDTIDIHTGGIDHIPVHHTNEIAQSEAATGKEFVRYWVHHNFLVVDKEKMSKSKENFYTIDDIITKGFDPLSLRYLFLTAHYRDKLNFTWDSLTFAQNTLNNIRDQIRAWPSVSDTRNGLVEQSNHEVDEIWQKFVSAANHDLNMPQAVVYLHKLLSSNAPTSSYSRTLLKMDKILGLELDKYLGEPLEVPEEVQKLVEQREHARKAGDFKKADVLRGQVKHLGFELDDTASGTTVKKTQSFRI